MTKYKLMNNHENKGELFIEQNLQINQTFQIVVKMCQLKSTNKVFGNRSSKPKMHDKIFVTVIWNNL